MQLTLHSDYALRVLLYLASHPGRIVTTQEVSDAYQISKNHLVRVIQTLSGHGYLQVTPGRFGGVRLARAPEDIRLGEVIRVAEPNMRLVECFDRETNTCPIAPVCELKGLLKEAMESFLAVLDRHTVADLVARGSGKKLASAFAMFAVPGNLGEGLRKLP